VVRYWRPTRSFFLLGVLTSALILVKIDQEMWPRECKQTDTQIHWLTDANRFYNLSHAICYSYGTDKGLKNGKTFFRNEQRLYRDKDRCSGNLDSSLQNASHFAVWQYLANKTTYSDKHICNIAYLTIILKYNNKMLMDNKIIIHHFHHIYWNDEQIRLFFLYHRHIKSSSYNYRIIK